MVIRESQKLICKPLTQISISGGTERRGQNSPSLLMEEITFLLLLLFWCWCVYHTQKSIKIQWQRALRHFTGVSPGSAHQKLQGSSIHSRITAKRRGGKAQIKGPPLPFPPLCLAPGPYLAGGVCSQCFAEGQNSQSPDCRSCYSPGGRSEFLLPAEDVEKRECSLCLQHHTFPRILKSFNSRTPCPQLI